MATEIERKFLLASDAWRREVRFSVLMRQGYLGGSEGRSSIRVRVQGEPMPGPGDTRQRPLTVHGRVVPDAEARLNIKAAVVGRARAEYDYAVPMADAQQMLDTLCIGLVDKTRHYVERDGLTWEIDEFSGANAGLVVAEVELEADDQVIVRPDWLGEEVTDQRRYYNHALSLQPFRAWPENVGRA